MSTRTIIEINHDYLHDLLGTESYLWPRLLCDLRACGLDAKEKALFDAFGLRVLGQRHHSEPEWKQGSEG